MKLFSVLHIATVLALITVSLTIVLSRGSCLSDWLLGLGGIVVCLMFFLQGYAVGYSRGWRSCTAFALKNIANVRREQVSAIVFSGMVILLACACACASDETDVRSGASPELGSGGVAVVDWTPMLRGGSAGAGGAPSMASGGAATGGKSALPGAAGAAGIAGSAILEETGGAPSMGTGGSTAGGPSALPGAAGSAGTAGADVLEHTAGAATGGAPSSGVRVVFAATYGVPDDDEINTIVALENLGTEPLALKGLELRYWARMAFTPIECSCITAVCNASTVGAFRTGRIEANTCISFALPTGLLRSGQSLAVDFVCRHTNGTTFDERTHYSYPNALKVGDEMQNVTVSSGTKSLWGVEPK